MFVPARKFSLLTVTFALLCFVCGCLPESPNRLTPESFFENLNNLGQKVQALDPAVFPELNTVNSLHSPLGIYQLGNTVWALYDLPAGFSFDEGLFHSSNLNLHILSKEEIPSIVVTSLQSLTPQIGLRQLGVFAYPLALCMVITVFVSVERLFSLRRGATFPRKVQKALLQGEFPNKKWKKGSAAERIVHVAVNEKASEETIRAYARLEIATMERGMYLLEVIIAGAPLIGLLGTVTGLVQVFSEMPAGGRVDQALFSQGISLALLTTMAGLAIALPTLLLNSYLQRVLDKRAASIDWLTARLIEALDRKGVPPEVIR